MPTGAISLWARSVLRRSWGATLLLIVLSGATAGVVATALQGWSRAETSVSRFVDRLHTYDARVSACPPGVDPSSILGRGDGFEKCARPELAQRLRTVVAGLDGVETADVVTQYMVAVPDGRGSFHGALMDVATTNGAGLVNGNPIVVAGRVPDDAASDEIMIGEGLTRSLHLHLGDVIALRGWTTQGELEAAMTGLGPTSATVPSRIVGVGRFGVDLLPDSTDALGSLDFYYGLHAGPGWERAHGDVMASNGGDSVSVRLREGSAGFAAFAKQIEAGPQGWTGYGEPQRPATDIVDRSIATERNAVLAFSLITATAGLGFVGLIALRQFRQELNDRPMLVALGLTNRGLRMAGLLRASVPAVGASIFAAALTLALSNKTPFGAARRLEYSHPIRVDVLRYALCALGLFALYAGAALIAVSVHRAGVISGSTKTTTSSFVRDLGPSARVGASFVAGGSRVARIITVIAVAATVTAGVVVTNFDSLYRNPPRFGVWWDVAFGAFNEPAAYAKTSEALRHRPGVVVAAGINENGPTTVDELAVKLHTFEPIVGTAHPVLSAGREPRDGEIALGSTVARRLHKAIGDTVNVGGRRSAVRARIVGTYVVNSTSDAMGAGEAGLIPLAMSRRIAGEGLPFGVGVRFDRRVDLSTEIADFRREYSFTTRSLLLPPDVADLARLRRVPWLICGAIALLAAATVLHALLTLLRRRRRDLGVLATLGFDRRQDTRARVAAALVLVGPPAIVAVPIGVLSGRRLWNGLVQQLGVVPGWTLRVADVAVAPVAALVVAVAVAVVAGRRVRGWSTITRMRAE